MALNMSLFYLVSARLYLQYKNKKKHDFEIDFIMWQKKEDLFQTLIQSVVVTNIQNMCAGASWMVPWTPDDILTKFFILLTESWDGNRNAAEKNDIFWFN